MCAPSTTASSGGATTPGRLASGWRTWTQANRTVRMIYFLPNDRPFRQEVVDSMKVRIRQVQSFFVAQMEAHG